MSSSDRTFFLIDADKVVPDRLSCWKMEVKGGRRELTIPNKTGRNGPRAFRMQVTLVSGNIYKMELTEPLENGEYVLSPDGSNEVFAFSVY